MFLLFTETPPNIRSCKSRVAKRYKALIQTEVHIHSAAVVRALSLSLPQYHLGFHFIVVPVVSPPAAPSSGSCRPAREVGWVRVCGPALGWKPATVSSVSPSLPHSFFTLHFTLTPHKRTSEQEVVSFVTGRAIHGSCVWYGERLREGERKFCGVTTLAWPTPLITHARAFVQKIRNH